MGKELKQTEKLLNNNFKGFGKIFDESQIGILMVYEDLHIIESNNAFCNMLGYSKKELKRINFKDIIHPDNQIGDVESLNRLMSGEIAVYKTEGRFIRKDQKVFWGTITHSAIHNKKGQLLCCVSLIEDITERKLTVELLKESEAKLKEQNAIKDKFFSIIANDMKSPFNSILGFSDILKEEVKQLDASAIEDYASMINTAAHQTYNLLEELLNWSRLQQGQLPFNPTSIVLREVVKEVLALLAENANQKNIALINHISGDLIVKADENLLKTIIRNLISNAIKFTSTGGKVELQASEGKEHTEVPASDNGTGLKQEELEKIFKLEMDNTTYGTSNEKGTGLDLFLCKEFVEKHGGKIWAESEFGKGSTFKFTLPANRHTTS